MEDVKNFSRVCKELMESKLETELKQHPDFVITNYSGLSGNDLNEFRRGIKKTSSKYFVVKNRLCKRVFGRLNLKDFENAIEGACGITLIGPEPVETAKFMIDYAKKHEPLVVKIARIDGQRMDVDRLKTLASLPSRDVLLAMIASAIQAPISGFVNVLGGVLRSFAYAINAVKEKKEKGN